MSLSQKEKLRVGKTAEQLKKQKQEGFKAKEITISATAANIMGLVWGNIIFVPVLILYYCKFGYVFADPLGSDLDFYLAILASFVLIILHELIHGVCMYLFNGRDKSAIEYGINSTMPYCTCQKPIKKSQYIIVLLAPTIIIGLLTSIFALYIGRFWWLFLAFEMLVGGGGDLTIAAKILKEKVPDMCVVDHPYKCGFLSLSKNYNTDEIDDIINTFEDVENCKKD